MHCQLILFPPPGPRLPQVMTLAPTGNSPADVEHQRLSKARIKSEISNAAALRHTHVVGLLNVIADGCVLRPALDYRFDFYS